VTGFVESESSRSRQQQTRLAIVTTHPIQYYAPWFGYIAARSNLQLKVFYLWNPAATTKHDPGFGHDVTWDVPLLEGYAYKFVPNASKRPGSARFSGIDNPELPVELNSFRPDAALLIGYRYQSMQRLIFARARKFPLLLRGDSHRLAPEVKGQRSAVRGQESEVKSQETATRSQVWNMDGVGSAAKRLVIRCIFRRFDAFLYVGRANRDYFRIHGVPEEKLFFAPHAVENERFLLTDEQQRSGRAWRAELGIPENNLLVVFAGKFEPKKRPLDLLRAFSKLNQTNLALLFVGAGVLEPALREAVAVMERVFFAPFQNQSLMPRTYAAADLFVLPSYGNEETWGLAINEALCAAKPVVVSNHVGCGPDLVVPNVNGLIFEAGNVDSLAAALKEALSDKERLIRWGLAGQSIVSKYDFAHATEGLERALGSVVTSHANQKQ